MSSTKSFTNELVKRQQSKKRLNEDIQRFLENKKQTRRNVMRNHAEGHQRIYDQYFAPGEGMYSEETFRRRFRMKRSLFQRIMNDVQGNDAYFEQKKDCTGKLGLSALQKVVAALRQLTYGVPADSLDEYIQIGESTALECLLHFCSAVVEVHGQEYLREPNEEDTKRLLEENARRGFPGMLGSLDCMHWEWKNCPTAWHGQYKGKEKTPTLVLEAVASQDTWIWHAFFGMPGSLNDINVLDRSYLFSSLAEGARPAINYSVNGNNYEMGYYLVDGIYPSYATLIKSISHPYTEKQKKFAQRQESVRKDVERAFGVLQSRFAIIRGPARMWSKEDLELIMKTCVLLHNMIVEDERDDEGAVRNYENYTPVVELTRPPLGAAEFIQRHQMIRDNVSHYRLRNDLIEHVWNEFGKGALPLDPVPQTD